MRKGKRYRLAGGGRRGVNAALTAHTLSLCCPMSVAAVQVNLKTRCEPWLEVYFEKSVYDSH